MAKSSTQIIEDMSSVIRASFPTLDISEGELFHDVVLRAPALEFASIHNLIEILSNAQSIFTADENALEKHASNVGLLRKGARLSRGSVTFFRTSPITSNITIPAGTKIGTRSTESETGVQFSTLQEVTFYYLQSNLYFNSSRNRYEITADIECTQAGTKGIVGAGNIIEMLSTISGIDGCINYTPTSGGLDIESTQSLIKRIQARWQGASSNTKSGILSKVLAIDEVIDASIVANGETGRDDYGVVDIYIKGTISRNRVEAYTSYATNIENIVLKSQPVLSINSVSSSSQGLISSNLYNLTLDPNSYGGSVIGFDTLTWLTSLPTATYGLISINYQYNGLIEDVQSNFLQDENSLINTNIIIREARAIPIDLEVTVKVLAGLGFDLTTIQSDVQSALAIFFNAKNIGEEIQQADIAFTILQIPGVDDLEIPFNIFQSADGSIVQNSSNNIVIPQNSYGIAGTIVVNTSY